MLGSSVTLNRIKLRDSLVCEACPNNDHIHIYMPSLDLTELSPLQFLIYDPCYYFSQECGDFFDLIGKKYVKKDVCLPIKCFKY